MGRCIFDGGRGRLFGDPSSASEIVHSAALQAFFDTREADFRDLLDRATEVLPSSALKVETLNEDSVALEEFIRRLRTDGLDELARAVRARRLYDNGIEFAFDWLLRQPAIVDAVLSLRQTRSDGSFVIEWTKLRGVLAGAIDCSDVESLKELFEDCGHHYFVRDIDEMLLLSSNRA
jgi:hypothetical protein